MQILEKWTPQEKQAYGSEIQTFSHKLADSGLFTDGALADLLDRHPRHLIDVCTMEVDPDYPNRHVTVDPNGASGAQLVETAKTGEIWINIREAMNHDPAYQPLMADAYMDLQVQTGQSPLKRNRRGGILISSPAARVPYHCDPTQTLLWHIRGRKRVFVYPTADKFLPDEAYEAILLGERDQDIPYAAEFDKDAKVFDLEDNTLVCWPHTSPHRVVNQGYCVSMVMEFTTSESAERNGAMYFNGFLRRKLDRNPSWASTIGLQRKAKALAGHSLRKMGAHRRYVREDVVKYRLSGDQVKTLVPCAQYLRDF